MNQTPEQSDEQKTPTTETGTEQTQEASVQPQSSPQVDYEKKFRESSRGAQQLLDRNKALEAENQRLQELMNSQSVQNEVVQPVPQPEPQLTPSYQSVLDPETATLIQRVADREKFELEFAQATTRYPQLSGRKEEFKQFAYQEDNLGVPTLQLAAEFILEKGLYSKPEENQDEMVEPALESGVGGDRQAPPKDGYTVDEAKHLRETDPRKYNRLIREGKMKIKQ